MLGLSATVNSEEGYAKGERYRERFHEIAQGDTYDASTNPIGRDGQEEDGIGAFSLASHDDHYAVVNANVALVSGTLRTRLLSSGGYSSIAISTVPKVQYTVSYQNDPDNSASTDYAFNIGTAAGGSQIATTSIAHASSDNAKITSTFNSGANNVVYLSWVGDTSGKMIFIDDMSFKEA